MSSICLHLSTSAGGVPPVYTSEDQCPRHMPVLSRERQIPATRGEQGIRGNLQMVL